jgi:outer membrane protein OmpA-like peptidoglycan-associated protein
MFFTEKQGNGWSKPKKFNKYMSTSRYEPNGFVINNESLVYFSSGRESKNGNLDLFVSRRDTNNTWSTPERLLGLINTDADEDAPFLADDGRTLYFCSRGHDSMGGYDVFKTTFDLATKTWSKPLNMGYPINTPADDIYFIADSLNKEYHVTSNREGTVGQEDIFAVKLYGTVLVKGSITDKRSGIALPGITINFVAQRKPDIKSGIKTEGNGLFATGLRSNYAYNVEIRNDEGDVLLLDVLEIEPAYEENTELIKNYQVSLPSDALALQGQRIRVENLNLVKMQYQPSDSLILYGIVNSAQGVVPDAEVRVRREDSRDILYETQTDDEGAYAFRFVPNDKTDYIVEIYKEGYLLNSIAVLYNEKVDARAKGNQLELESTMVNSVDANTRLTEIKVGAKQVLGGVYFEFNSAKLLTESAIALDKLVAFLKENPTITMEIGGHTDDLGSEQINKQMSLRRAQSVVNYLIQRGIPRRRVVAAGYGETEPITSNESALNGRDVNRRVEVKILSK